MTPETNRQALILHDTVSEKSTTPAGEGGGAPPTSNLQARKRRKPLKLGNRFARLGENLEPTCLDPMDAGNPMPALHTQTAPAELSPEIWEFFNRDSFERRFFGPRATPPETQAQLERVDPPAPQAQTACETIKILLVEDNPGHVRLMQEAFQESHAEFTMTVVPDGQQAMEYLHQQGTYRDAELPHLILLDLSLPKKNGHEVLAEIKTSEALAKIPVVVLTASSDKEDIQLSYNLHANCYLTKPTNLNEFANVVKIVENFWGSFVRLP